MELDLFGLTQGAAGKPFTSGFAEVAFGRGSAFIVTFIDETFSPESGKFGLFQGAATFGAGLAGVGLLISSS
jgi:hypothetical protein